MVRIPRRTHSVSGPPSVHCVWKDVACCCNIDKIQQFYVSMIALRRNSYRKCKKDDVPAPDTPKCNSHWRDSCVDSETERLMSPKISKGVQHKLLRRPSLSDRRLDPFLFFELPREVRDHIYAYLVVNQRRRIPVLEANSILREQKKRTATQKSRARLNLKRIQTGLQPIAPRDSITDPVVHLNITQASRLLSFEASDCFYQRNWFAVSIDSLPAITKMQLELQIKDAQRMNSYINWAPFFAMFPSLRILRIIPSFHTRYYDWAHTELDGWSSAHYVFRAFFRELLASIPDRWILKLGPSLDPQDDMQLEGKAPIHKRVLWDMYADLRTRKDIGGNGHFLAINRIVDCGES